MAKASIGYIVIGAGIIMLASQVAQKWFAKFTFTA